MSKDLFVKMPVDLLFNKSLSATDKLVFCRLKYCGETVFISQNKIKDEIQVCKSTLKTSLKRLEKAGFIVRYRHGRKTFYNLYPDFKNKIYGKKISKNTNQIITVNSVDTPYCTPEEVYNNVQIIKIKLSQ